MKRPMQMTPAAFVRFLPPLLAMVFVVLTSAHAANASTTVLVLSAGDETSEAFLQSNTEAALRDAAIQVAKMEDALLAGFDPVFTIACLDNGEVCDALLMKAPAEWVLLVRLRASGEGSDADRTVIAQLYSADDGSLLQVSQRVCQRCGSNERLVGEIRELVQEIASDELAHKARETYLDVSSSPPLAILRIDGVVVGQTGRAYRVRPGEHTIELEHKGYRSATQSLQVNPDEHKALSVILSKESSSAEGGTKLRAIVSYSSLGLGAGALTAGLAWLVLDGEPNDEGGEASRDLVLDTKGLGIISLVAGSVLVGAGVALLVTGDGADTSKVHVHAMPSSEGLSLGLRGHF